MSKFPFTPFEGTDAFELIDFRTNKYGRTTFARYDLFVLTEDGWVKRGWAWTEGQAVWRARSLSYEAFSFSVILDSEDGSKRYFECGKTMAA